MTMATSDLPSYRFPGATTKVKDAALGVLPHGPNPQWWLPLLLTLPDPQVSGPANRAWISATPKPPAGGGVLRGCRIQPSGGLRHLLGQPPLPSLGGGQTLSSKEVV